MHGLDVIITRNAYAAGREAAHEDNDRGTAVSLKYRRSRTPSPSTRTGLAYLGWREGYRRGVEDDFIAVGVGDRDCLVCRTVVPKGTGIVINGRPYHAVCSREVR